MSDRSEGDGSVLRSKRDATRYQILAEIAEHQPAVSQREIAEAIGVTSQAVSDYLRGLVERDYVRKHGRGRYEVTKEGVDWLIGRTDELREYVDHVSKDIIGEVEVETAIATADIAEGDTVSLTMRDGALHATPSQSGSTTAVAVTDAPEGRDVGVTDFEGVLDYELGKVTIVSIPEVRNGGSEAIDVSVVGDLTDDHDLLAVAGTEALAAARRAEADPDLRFGTAEAVREAATKGLDALLLAVTTELTAHTDPLREQNVRYEVIDAAE